MVVERRYAPAGPAPGDEIVSINQVAASSLIGTLVQHSSAATDYARVMDVQDNFSLGLWWVFGWSGRFRVETRTAVHDVQGLTAKDLDARRREASRPGAAVSDKQYEYTQISPTVGRLVFRDFGIRDTAAYSRFLETSFRELRGRAIPNLIIDVRGHGGGGDPFGVEIVKARHEFEADLAAPVIHLHVLNGGPVRPVQSVRDPQDRRQLGHGLAIQRIKLGVWLVPELRASLTMITGH